MVFWDYFEKRKFLVNNMTAQDIFRFRGNTPHFDTFGEEGDISNIYQFVWYEWVYFHESSAAFSLSSHLLGRCLGPAMNERNECPNGSSS